MTDASRERPAFVCATRAAGVPPDEVVRLAARLGAEPLFRPPWPADRLGMVLTAEGPRLQAPGHAPLRWHPGLTASRLARVADDALVRALGLVPGASVLDLTLGLGHDALVLCAAGARVTALEAEPLLAHLTGEALRARLGAEAPLVCAQPAEQYVATATPGAFHHVYADPLFETTEGEAPTEHPNLAVVRAVGRGGRFGPALLEAALRLATRTLVLRLGPGEAAPVLSRAVAREVRGRRRRYAVYDAPSDSP